MSLDTIDQINEMEWEDEVYKQLQYWAKKLVNEPIVASYDKLED